MERDEDECRYGHVGWWKTRLLYDHRRDKWYVSRFCQECQRLVKLRSNAKNGHYRGIRRRPARREFETMGESVGGERRWKAKLTVRDVKAIRRQRKAGIRVMDLATRYGVHKTTISRLLHGKAWKGIR